jgi:hypothetical protein
MRRARLFAAPHNKISLFYKGNFDHAAHGAAKLALLGECRPCQFGTRDAERSRESEWQIATLGRGHEAPDRLPPGCSLAWGEALSLVETALAGGFVAPIAEVAVSTRIRRRENQRVLPGGMLRPRAIRDRGEIHSRGKNRPLFRFFLARRVT